MLSVSGDMSVMLIASLCLYSNVEVLTTLTTDVGRILSKLHQVQPKGDIKFCTGVKVAHVGSTRESFSYCLGDMLFRAF